MATCKFCGKTMVSTGMYDYAGQKFKCVNPNCPAASFKK